MKNAIHKSEEWFSVVILPDSQRYVEDGYREERIGCLQKQTDWILENREKENIKFVSHVGDYVHHRESVTERRAFFEVFDRLTGIVPFGICAGNHDLLFGERSKEVLDGRGKVFGCEIFDQPNVRRVRDAFFSQEKYQKYDYWIDSCNDCQSNAQKFEALGQEYVIVHLEFSPSDHTVDWADGILKKYADIPAIITTHNFITPEEEFGVTTRNSRLSSYQENMAGEGDNAGTDILEKLVIPNQNVFMVLCGHFADQRFVTLKNEGREIYAMLSDYELEKPYYGNGWMRVLRFFPKQNRVSVSTYSPFLDEYKTDNKNKFDFKMLKKG
ncbi:MAG TPA: metallophosphoesterase [Oscillospiraceae bacterium]|nr:metallophosphoesterase [Oscillospiraceae bacterium]HPF56398.1 metallophosphoesterase [Clostridiales bacterium]HPK34816.1 metallophosphoesterase [Oscillospiraceae bacterium]HPR76776.1 metallophosphoesterase [Oscillospiraceae bacterium]